MIRLIFLFRHQWLILALVFLAAGFFISTLDVVVGDTYIVIQGRDLGLISASMFGTMWVLYRFMPAFRTIRLLAKIHLVLNSLLAVVIWLLLLFPSKSAPTFRDYTVITNLNSSPESSFEWLAVLPIVFIAVQLIWLIQAIAFALKERRPKG